jgi:hypothetical protein
MKNQLFILLIAFGIILIGLNCENSTTPVSSTGPVVENSEYLAKAEVTKDRGIFLWDDLVSGECLGEDLQMNVEYDYLMHSTLDANGGFRILLHMRPVAGVATGVKTGYTWSSVGTNKWKDMWLKSGETHVMSGTEHWHANQDSPDLIEHWQFSTKIDADGELKFEKQIIRITCK